MKVSSIVLVLLVVASINADSCRRLPDLHGRGVGRGTRASPTVLPGVGGGRPGGQRTAAQVTGQETDGKPDDENDQDEDGEGEAGHGHNCSQQTRIRNLIYKKYDPSSYAIQLDLVNPCFFHPYAS